MRTLDDIINNSKKQLSSIFYKIVKDGDKFRIKKYAGPKKSFKTMTAEGWLSCKSLEAAINEDYPVFNLDDFKAVNENTLVKRSDQDLLQDELLLYIKYFKLSNDLYLATKNLKDLLTILNINSEEYDNFSEIYELVLNSMDQKRAESVKCVSLFTIYVNKIYLGLEKLNISNPRTLFDEKFNYFFALIK